VQRVGSVGESKVHSGVVPSEATDRSMIPRAPGAGQSPIRGRRWQTAYQTDSFCHKPKKNGRAVFGVQRVECGNTVPK